MTCKTAPIALTAPIVYATTRIDSTTSAMIDKFLINNNVDDKNNFIFHSFCFLIFKLYAFISDKNTNISSSYDFVFSYECWSQEYALESSLVHFKINQKIPIKKRLTIIKKSIIIAAQATSDIIFPNGVMHV